MLGNEIHIMWGEIIFSLLFLYGIRFLIDQYLVKEYKKILEDFYSNKWTGIYEKIERCQKVSDIFSNGPWNKNNRWIYNNLCIIRASIFYVNGDILSFLKNLDNIKKEKDFELKAFLLFLYYYSEKNEDKISKYYYEYLKTVQENKDIATVIHVLMGTHEYMQETNFEEAIKNFKNPAIIELFEKIR